MMPQIEFERWIKQCESQSAARLQAHEKTLLTRPALCDRVQVQGRSVSRRQRAPMGRAVADRLPLLQDSACRGRPKRRNLALVQPPRQEDHRLAPQQCQGDALQNDPGVSAAPGAQHTETDEPDQGRQTQTDADRPQTADPIPQTSTTDGDHSLIIHHRQTTADPIHSRRSGIQI